MIEVSLLLTFQREARVPGLSLLMLAAAETSRLSVVEFNSSVFRIELGQLSMSFVFVDNIVYSSHSYRGVYGQRATAKRKNTFVSVVNPRS